ncbi:unnamed protein product [Didymodactylos carnosus]|uniref:Alpha-1,3-mannosyl-glycoprotein 2-beta-N-acetylglucosaminyltransferase n=1 Tax=Didymodactylos carnosus TaxID=1234261 RepID=A0A813Y1I7_9BILA|nr:unnamed protein product [Didymodactylos carnosus]CAF3660694.1 unnamed protein product [Didymodactylos carnosus]
MNVDKSLSPVALLNKTLEDNPIYSTPILIIAGISHNSLRMCLETVLMQPGVNLQNVIVAVDEKFIESLALIDLFGFHGEKIPSSNVYMEHYEKALKKVWELHPTKDKIIVIEEDLILSPDFLYTLALLSEPFRKDETIGGIAMWNPNSYEDVDGSSNLIYRVDELYGLGYLLRRSFYDTHMKTFSECCSKRVWDRWKFDDNSHSFLIPDISRVFRRPVDGNHDNMKYLARLFNRKRKTSLNPFPGLTNVDTLRKETYDATLSKSIASAILLKLPTKCDTLFKIDISVYNTSQTFKYIYNQSSSTDYSNLSLITRCFGLFYHETTNPMGLYHGVLRFSSNDNNYYLVGSKSSLYSSSSDPVRIQST